MTAPTSSSPALARLIDRVRHAQRQGERLVIQGGGSKRFYGSAPPQASGLDTRELSGIVSYEPSELVVTARAGTPLAELEAALAAQGQYLPFEPPHFAGDGPGRATVGGMVAAGLSGPGRASAGAVRDYMLGVAVVDGRGQWLQFGGQVMKNVAGYDVSRLMAGSLGALGVIAEVSLKVLPRPVAQATLAFALPQQAALDALNRWGGQPLPLQASVWHGGRLLLRLAGARAAVEAATALLARQYPAEVVGADDAQTAWQDWREQRVQALQAQPGEALWRLSVPQTAPAVAWPMAQGEPAIEWHGAQRWVHAPVDAAEALRSQAAALGGHATLFRAAAAPATASVPVFHPQPAALARIQARLRQAFDPDGVFAGGHLGLADVDERAAV
ncbi:MAG: putative FAD-linked oxidoreductase [Paracidovorax wautersii]|uniref:Putative FAD-linked oxidoreductase n=1 Tax=Paracidovorax wautersii TaxID=1177982 RepID=A0A7V8FP05_9BURK|nr:MAG: putative FAD-linked oxidoreductase [Paracidovorax wautersii]